MNWLQKIFGYRTSRAPAGSLDPAVLAALGNLWGHAMSVQQGVSVVAYAVANTNSMVPTFDANAVLLAEAVDFSALGEGDVVTYRSVTSPGKLVVHRLNERRGANWWPLGDGNGSMDGELVTPQNFDRRICGILYGKKASDTDR